MLIDHIIQTIGFTRKHFLDLTAGCTTEAMNAIPKGFGNNLVWNLGHVISSQQTLCYSLSHVDPVIDQRLVDRYKLGSAPEAFVREDEIMEIRLLAQSTVQQLSVDYHSGLFKRYDGRQTRYGVLLSNLEEAISYISTHETLHFGYAKAMLKALHG